MSMTSFVVAFLFLNALILGSTIVLGDFVGEAAAGIVGSSVNGVGRAGGGGGGAEEGSRRIRSRKLLSFEGLEALGEKTVDFIEKFADGPHVRGAHYDRLIQQADDHTAELNKAIQTKEYPEKLKQLKHILKRIKLAKKFLDCVTAQAGKQSNPDIKSVEARCGALLSELEAPAPP